LLDAIRNNPKSVRFEDACKAAEMAGEAVILNFQDRKGWIAEYQAKQLINMLNKYGSES
jgi:hypothetical protein